MDSKSCWWPGHPLFRLTIEYAFDSGEKLVLRLVTGVALGEEGCQLDGALAAARNDWLEGLKLIILGEPSYSPGPTAQYSLIRTAANCFSIETLNWLRRRWPRSYLDFVSSLSEDYREQLKAEIRKKTDKEKFRVLLEQTIVATAP